MQLREEDAWAIAMTWKEPLQGSVRLAKDKARSMRLVKCYEWIRLEPKDSHRDQPLLDFAAMARYATLTWFALSCVPGYSATENPVFWRRVFDVLQRKIPANPLNCQRQLVAVTDTVRFFPDDTKPFPRVRVYLPTPLSKPIVTEFCRVFCGTLEHPNRGMRAKLLRLLAQLRPFVDTKEVHRVVDVELKLEAISPQTLSRQVHSLLAACTTRVPTHASVEKVVRPEFVVRQISFRGDFWFFATSDVRGISQLVRETLVDISRIRFGVYDAVRRGAFARFVYDVFQFKQQSLARVQVLSVPMSFISRDKFDAVCSALPYARSVHTLQLDRRLSDSFVLPIRDAAWLAYSIFHPDAVHSTWKTLDLEMVHLSTEHAKVFRAMARGNNLLSILDGTPPTSRAYYSAQLVKDTPVYSEPRLDATILTLKSVTSRFDVCVDSEHVCEMNEWVCLIVPCWGRAWIQKVSIVDVIARQPSRPFLTGLRLMAPGRSHDTIAMLSDVLRFIGQHLECLDIRYMKEVSSEMLRGILTHCPVLRSLDVRHDGRLWAEASTLPDLPHLKELGLFLREDQPTFSLPCEKALTGCLRKLTALRITTPYCTRIDSSREALLTILRRLPLLQYLHWIDVYAPFAPRCVNPTLYAEARDKSWRLVETPSISQKTVARKGWNAKCILAIISVAKWKETEGSAFALFNRDLVSHIANYAAPASSLDLWVDLYPGVR